jgi:uroporphyrinogen-III synthase
LQPNNASLLDAGKYDWLFFSSPKSVRLFSELYSLNSETKIATLSERTKMELVKKFNSKVHFVGNNSSVEETAKAFSQVVSQSERVLFPIGNRSRRTVQKFMKTDNWSDFTFYKTEISDKRNNNCNFDAVFLSSPSQSKGWLTAYNEKESKSIVLSFFGSTNIYLESQGIRTITVENYNRESVFNALNSHLGQTD